MSFERIALSRREVVKSILGFAVLSATTSLTPISFADDKAPGTPFSFADLTARMQALAQKPYAPDDTQLPDFLAKLSYDAYQKIQPRNDRALDLGGEGIGYKVEPFHMGWLFKEPVLIFDVKDATATEKIFTAADFDYHDPATAAAMAKIDLPGVAGFRLDYPMNQPDKIDEVAAFLGASYFRALGRGNYYGLSARGAVLNSWLAEPEEFPRFSSFYMEHTAAGEPLTGYATLEGPSLTGAFRFTFDPGTEMRQETLVEVTARFFFRKDVTEFGVAPLTSMFLYADNNRSQFDDFRPQVHDSQGLLMVNAGGEMAWRALNNPPTVANSYFHQTSPKAFGLMQRDRNFDAYQDAGARYDLRPSVLIEPLGDWGEGDIRLIEAPIKLEADDNIGVFWVPKIPFKAGDHAEFSYRLRWGNLDPDPNGTLAYVLDTRSGQGGVSGVANKQTLRKFVIDFKGGPFNDPDLDPSTIDSVATISGGKVNFAAVSKLPDDGVMRLAIDAEIDTKDPVELRAYLIGGGRQLTETWLYQWRAA